MTILLRLPILVLAVFVCIGCTQPPDGASTPDGTTTLKLALNWYPEVEHGGFIAAKTLGLYDNAKLDVELVPGGPGAPQLVITELAAERILFAVSDADNVVKARASGLPIVAVLAPLQNSPRCIMVHQSSGFKTLEDLADVELAISESRPFALWMKKKLPLKNVQLVPFSGSVGEFLQKKAFAQQAFVFSEPFTAKEQGSDPQAMLVSDIGFNPYASLLVTTEKMIREQPDLVQSMVSASVAGWKEYLADPGVTNAAIHVMNKSMSPAALEFGASAMSPLCQVAENESLCNMTLERWKTLVQQIEDVEDIKSGSVKAEDCFTTQFLAPEKSAE
jgi:NitT/TauT family transport system substrate-binding protein